MTRNGDIIVAMYRAVAISCLVAAGLVEYPAAARDVRSVTVRVVGLEDVPRDLDARRVAVRVFIGSKRLYQTPWARGPAPTWNRSLRAFTAVGNPLRFEVVVGPSAPPQTVPSREPPPQAAPVPASLQDQDRTLATGFEELVGDWEAGLSPAPARAPRKEPRPPAASDKEPRPHPPPGAAEPPGVLCRAVLPWPPTDGEHRLSCATMVLLIRTSRSVGPGQAQ